MRPDQSSARGARVALATLGTVLVAAIAATPAGAAPSTGLVVNEVYGGGGNSGATYTRDFVEIANRGSSPVSVDGWSVQYHAASGTGAWQVTQLSGSIAPGAFYLVAEAAGSAGTTPLPTPQADGVIAMSATSGTIALVNGTSALTCLDSAACRSASVDLVGYGAAVINETAAAPGGSNTTSLQRKDAADSDDNSGMRVEVDDARVVGPSNDFGEQYVTTKPTQAATYRGGTELLAENAIPSGRVEVVPVNGSNPGVSVNDRFTGATVGPVDYSRFGGYTIAATTLGTVQHNNLPRITATAQGTKQLAVATYNVENLAPSDPASKFQRLADGVVTNLAKPDIVAVEEVQDDTGDTDDGTVTANQTLTKLTDAIVAAGGPRYDWREIDPVNDQDGGEPGGNIRVVFLFNPARVSFVARGSSSVNRSITGTSVVKSHGDPALTLSPGRIDPTNPVWTTSRKPLAAEFSFRGRTVFAIANHFNSKGGDQSADGRFQFPAQSSPVQRAGQAQVVHDFVERILNIDRKADVVVLGDLNDYQFSPAISALRTGTADGSGPSILSDLINTLAVNQRYTYVFNGVSQVLDHILVSSGVGAVQYQVVHINAEYADQASDHDPQVVRLQP
jgi:predicted extracellular nuclease